MKYVLACDCGNSSVRVLLCKYNGGAVTMQTVLQEPNDMIRVRGIDYWDILRVFDLLKEGVRRAARLAHIDSIGICTWGVDFALFESGGFLLGNPLSYRNAIGARQMAKLGQEELRDMFFRTGILSDKINSVFMLSGMCEEMPGIVGAGKQLLMIPDILNYFFTGVMQREPSEFSTTQLMNVTSMCLDSQQCAYAGVEQGIFPPLGEHGKPVGMLTPELHTELGLDYDIPVVCVPSHDTASAVLGVPAPEENFAFVSAGTWALVGLHLPSPLVTEGVFRAGFTNEAGAFGRTTLLKNSVGLFIMQRLRKEYGMQLNRQPTWKELDECARGYIGKSLLVNVNHPDFFNPTSMQTAIWEHLTHSGQVSGSPEWSAVLSAAKASLAVSWADALQRIMEVTGVRYKRLYTVGGGARDREINQCCADVTGLELVACGEECACTGNAVAQLAYLCPELSYCELRGVAASSLNTEVYSRKSDKSALLAYYRDILIE